MPGPSRFAAPALLLASLVVCCAAAEIALRVARPRAVSRVVQPCIYQPDEELGFRYRPGAVGRVHRHFEIDQLVRINALGYHDTELPATKGPGPRIAVLGDSFTSAIYLDPDRGWVRRLEVELRRLGWSTAQVVNLGLDGTGTDVQLAILERQVERLDPDLVVLAFYGNDVEDVALGPFTRECHRGYVIAFQDEAQRDELRARIDQHQDRPVRAALSAWAFDRVYLARAGLFALAGPRNLLRMNFLVPAKDEVIRSRAALGRTAPALAGLFERFEAHAAEYGFDFVVLPVPAKVELAGSARLLERLGALPYTIDVLDVASEIQRRLQREGRRPEDLFWHHDNHLDALGNAVFAEASARALHQHLGALRQQSEAP